MDASKRLVVDDLWTVGQPLPGRKILTELARRCGCVWDMPNFAASIRIIYNPRLRTTAGRAMIEERRVELNTRLLTENPAELIPTLVHELAHLAALDRYGYGNVSPHGRHFITLMRSAGFSGEATHHLPVTHLKRRRRRYLYLHRCSDCDCSFIARTPRRNYYCRECGPDLLWTIVRAPNSKAGHEALKRLRTGDEIPVR